MSTLTNLRHQQIRKYDKYRAHIILRLCQFFECERLQDKRINVQKVVERTAAATGASKIIVARIKTDEDVQNWLFDSGESLKTKKKGEVTEKHSALVRHVVRDIYLDKNEIPIVDNILDKTSAVKLQDM